MLTKECYESLIPLEEYFYQAKQEFLVNQAPSRVQKVAAAYHEIHQIPWVGNKGCGRCILRLYKEIADHYFAAKEYYTQKNTEKSNVTRRAKK